MPGPPKGGPSSFAGRMTVDGDHERRGAARREARAARADRGGGRALPRAAVARSSRRSGRSASSISRACRRPRTRSTSSTCSPRTSRCRRSRWRRRSRMRPTRRTASSGCRPYERDRHARLTAEEVNDLLETRRGLEPGALRRLPRGDRRRATASSTASCARCDGEGEGIPIALKDVIGDEGRRDHGRLEDPRRLRSGLRLDRRRRAARRAGCRLLGKTNTDEFAMGSSTENSAYGPSRNPWDPRASRAGRAAARRPRSPPGWRRGRSAPTRAARSSSRPRSAATSACGRRTALSRRYGIVAFASSLDQVGPVTKTVRDCAFLTR